MTALNAMPPAAFYAEVTTTLRKAGRQDLAEQFVARFQNPVLTSAEAARELGLSSPNTVKNWLAGGYFPGASRTAGGHWRFLRVEVEAVKQRMTQLREQNDRGDLRLPDTDDDSELPLL